MNEYAGKWQVLRHFDGGKVSIRNFPKKQTRKKYHLFLGHEGI